jgi:outer membrane protein assembly factor BamB
MSRDISSSKTSEDWPTLLKDNARTGGQGLRPARSPERAVWQFRAGGSVRSAPILHGDTLHISSLAGMLHAVDVVTGKSKWKFKAGGQIHSTPSLFGDKILFGSDDGKVYAVDRNN